MTRIGLCKVNRAFELGPVGKMKRLTSIEINKTTAYQEISELDLAGTGETYYPCVVTTVPRVLDDPKYMPQEALCPKH